MSRWSADGFEIDDSDVRVDYPEPYQELWDCQRCTCCGIHPDGTHTQNGRDCPCWEG